MSLEFDCKDSNGITREFRFASERFAKLSESEFVSLCAAVVAACCDRFGERSGGGSVPIGSDNAGAVGGDGGSGSDSIAQALYGSRSVECGRGTGFGVAGDGRIDGSGVECVRVDSSAITRGDNWKRNARKRAQRRRKQMRDSVGEGQAVPEWRIAAAPLSGVGSSVVDQKGLNDVHVVRSVASSLPSYGKALSDAEREARDSLARRRTAENKLQERLASMKLANLLDEKKVQEYADLKHQRLIQYTNEALAKSQASLERCKSIDPGSSASQYEIRRQAKRLADLEHMHEELIRAVEAKDPGFVDSLHLEMAGTSTMDEIEAMVPDIEIRDPADGYRVYGFGSQYDG